MQAMIMTVPPTRDTMESILATRPRRTAPSKFPCSKLFLDWRRRLNHLLAPNPHIYSRIQSVKSSSYHDGVDESHDVYGPDGAETGQHRQEEVVLNFGAVQWRVGGDAGVAWERRPGWEGGVANGAGPAPLPGLAMMGVRDGVLPSGRGGDDRGGAVCSCWVDPVTYAWRTKRTGNNWADSAAAPVPPAPPPHPNHLIWGQSRSLTVL